MDHPLSNLDAKLRAAARTELQMFQRQLGITTIFVTHDQIEAMGLGDRIVVMLYGRVRQIGTPQEIYHDPADTFVATFLGSPPMNLIDRRDYLIGFRPENYLPKEVYDSDPSLTTLPFKVERVEYLGADRLVYGVVADDAEEKLTTAKLPSTVTLSIEEDKIHDFVIEGQHLKFFDKETGLKIAPQPSSI